MKGQCYARAARLFVLALTGQPHILEETMPCASVDGVVPLIHLSGELPSVFHPLSSPLLGAILLIFAMSTLCVYGGGVTHQIEDSP